MSNKQLPQTLLRIALPIPLRRAFDYLPPEDIDPANLKPGIRLKVPFGNSKKQSSRVGILLEVFSSTEYDQSKLKICSEILDTVPLFTEKQLKLLLWANAYYHHCIGETLFSAIPTLLRKGTPAVLPATQFWRITPSALSIQDSTLNRAVKQKQLLNLLTENPDGLSAESLIKTGTGWRNVIKRLIEKGWVEEFEKESVCLASEYLTADQKPTRPDLNTHQAASVEKISTAIEKFDTFMLDGVTGSGKTEVYFRIIDKVVSEKRQALILIPEIGLTAQLIDRFKRRFHCPITVLHSGLSDQERLKAWLFARDGKASIVIGTRSAIWTPMSNLGIIIVDEEHDGSYKQQDGFRYSARDIAIVRAKYENIPILLGSATPSLESLNNIQQGKCQHLILPERAGNAVQPPIKFLDIKSADLINGLSKILISKIEDCLKDNKQALLFLNRRGFSPVMMCHDCGWIAACRHCDANLTFHQAAGQMRCHHCGMQHRTQTHCPECEDSKLTPMGQGTEQITKTLESLFPNANILRIDRDSTSRKGEMDRMLAMIQSNEADILVGTQMLSKGHHFPNVTLVGVLDADNRLYGSDFRSTERLAQLIIQVAGRAGRAEHPGEVLIQTHHPDHPVLQSLAKYDFSDLAKQLMSERSEAILPPFSSMAIIRADSIRPGHALNFLHEAKTQLVIADEIEIWGPVPAQMERRAGRYRAQLVIQSTKRQQLHQMIDMWIPLIESLKKPANLRWSLDIDPQDTF
ncbi:MAG: primosomal protein N' [Gammaproteobacteria bacterium]